MHPSPYDQPYRGGFVGKQHRFALTVFFEDTDTAIVYYANYLKFMERARPTRCGAAEQTNGPPRRMEQALAWREVGINSVRPSSATIFWSCPPCSKFGRQALSFISASHGGPNYWPMPASPQPSSITATGRSASRAGGREIE